MHYGLSPGRHGQFLSHAILQPGHQVSEFLHPACGKAARSPVVREIPSPKLVDWPTHSSLARRFCAGFFDNPYILTLDSLSTEVAKRPWAAFDVQVLRARGNATLNSHTLGHSLNSIHRGDVLARNNAFGEGTRQSSDSKEYAHDMIFKRWLPDDT